MATHNITGIRTTTYTANKSTDIYNLKADAIISSPLQGIVDAPGANNNVYNLAGKIYAVNSGVEINNSRTTINVASSADINSANIGLYHTGTTRFDADIDGRVSGLTAGIATAANLANVNVGTQAEVIGIQYGIYLTGGNKVDVNVNGGVTGYLTAIASFAADTDIAIGKQGEVISSQYAVLISLGGANVSNNGYVSGQAAIVGDGTASRIVNGEDGTLIGAYGINLSSGAGDIVRTINHGLIVGATGGYAYAGNDGNDRIVNDGRMIGGLTLGNGQDMLDTRGGIVKGLIYSGDGNDTLWTDRANHKLVESGGAGTDTVNSTVDYVLSDNVEYLYLIGKANIDGTGNAGTNSLFGNSGNNYMQGLAGTDQLHGRAGNDRLRGGTEADTFKFMTGGDHDKILDLQTGIDTIQVADWEGIENFSQLKNHARNVGGDVIIELGSDSLLIVGYQKNTLDINDFDFS